MKEGWDERPLLELDNVAGGYGNLRVLHGVSVKVEAGEGVLVAGPNGAGKTTLLRAVMGSIDVAGGTIKVVGSDLSLAPQWRRARSGLGIVPEGRRVFSRLTVHQNLVMGAHNWLHWRSPGPEFKDMLSEIVGVFPVLGERLEMPAGALSGGQQQMLAIARALMARPKILLLDEPSLGLAPLATRAVFEGLIRLRQRNPRLGVLLVEQNLSAGRLVADNAYVLRSGRVVWQKPQGRPLDLTAIAAAFFGDPISDSDNGSKVRAPEVNRSRES